MRTVASLILLMALANPLAAQVPGLPPAQPAAPAPPPALPGDPLGRDTPRGTITAFIKAVHRDDFNAASKCLQLKTTDAAKIETLSRDLADLMDRYFGQAITSISDEPAGTVNDGLPDDQERAATLGPARSRVDLMLVRVKDPGAGQIWLISADTLSKVPALHAAVHATPIERIFPPALLTSEFLGAPWALWITLVASFAAVLVAVLLGVGLARFAANLVIRAPQRRRRLDSWHRELRTPVVVLLTLLLQMAALTRLGFPLQFRMLYGQVVLVAAVIVTAWLARRLVRLFGNRLRGMMSGTTYKSTRSLIVLAERALNVVIVMATIFAILTIVGADTSTALAGVGIGGVALAFGAQRSVENLLGAVFLLTDKVLAVGDSCTISNRDGTVEDITLRSVRLRTAEQSLVSIPAGVVAQAGIENFASRRKFLIQTTVRLRYGTTAAQLRHILERIHAVLSAESQLETGTSRVRLVDFGKRAVEIQVFAYVMTTEHARFLEVREDLLLRIAEVIEASGSGFAQPTQFVYADETPSAPPDRRHDASTH